MKKPLGLLILLAPLVAAQTVTLNDASTYPAQRIGINLGYNNYYNSYLLKNRVSGLNASLQPVLNTQNIAVVSGTDTTFTDNDAYSGTPANFFAGGTFQVVCHGDSSAYCTGGNGPATLGADPGTATNIGCYGTIVSNTAANGTVGATYTVDTDTMTCPATPGAFAQYDQVYVYAPKTPTVEGEFNFNDFGWYQITSGTGTATIDTTSADFPSGFTGVQVVQLNTSTDDSSTAGIGTNYDTGGNATGTEPQYYFNGNYQQCIQADILSGTGLSLTMKIYRTSGDGINSSGTVTLSGSGYQTYCVTQTGAESGTENTPSELALITYTLSGQGTVDVIDPTVIAASDTSATVLNNTTVSNLQTWQPGQCRYWSAQNGESLDNWITPAWERLASQNGINVDSDTGYYFAPYTQIGLYDFLESAIAVGCSSVNIVVPITFRFNADAQNLVDFLNGPSSTTYGAKRIALGGPTAGYASVLNPIILSYGNEAWIGPPDGMSYYTGNCGGSSDNSCWNYIGPVIQFCGAMHLDANWDSSVMECAATTQTGIPYFTQYLASIDTNHYIDTFALNEYGLFDVTSPTSPAPWTSAYVEASQQNNHDTSSASGFQQAVTYADTAGRKVNVYEYQNSTDSGSATQAQLLGLPEGEGYGLPDTLMALEGNKTFGLTDYNFFTLYQNETGISTSGGATYINDWGAWVGPGGLLANPRPMVYAVAAVNSCIGSGDGYATSTSSVPTFDFSSANGINAESNVPYLWFYAFENGSTRCLVAENIDTSASHTFTVSGTNTPSGTVTQALYTGSLTDNNETPNSTPTDFTTTSTSSNPSSFTVPANSIVTETWTVGSTPPVLAPLNLEGIIIGPGLQIP